MKSKNQTAPVNAPGKHTPAAEPVMLSKATPGPWLRSGTWIAASFLPGQPMIAHTVSDSYRSAAEAEANAALIARAPELLARVATLEADNARLREALESIMAAFVHIAALAGKGGK